jgi:MFS family permease
VKTVARRTVTPDELTAWTTPWDGLVHEREVADGCFEAEEGPFHSYVRRVEFAGAADGTYEMTSTVEFRTAVPYFGWLIGGLLRVALRRPGAPSPWWAPADRLDHRAASVLGALAAASMITGFLGTTITQTITFVADDFGYEGDQAQADALAVARLSIVISLAIVAVADRRGRRPLLISAAGVGCVLAVTCSLAPSLAWFTATQTLLRGCSTAVAVLIAILAIEEVPAGTRAFAVSVLSMSAALGAGICVIALPLADLGDSGWRLVYLVPIVALPVLPGLARRVPESRRFERPHAAAHLTGHGQRLALLAASTFLIQIFAQPASQLQNEFLRDERGYSALAISAFTLCTATPAGIGILVAGRMADVRGRRIVGAVGLTGGVIGTIIMFMVSGWSMWVWSVIGSVVAGATVPSLGVYGPELFPTSVRARANGLLSMTGVAGAVVGLQLAGRLSDSLGSLGDALLVLSIAPAILVVLVLTLYPETAGLELETINPEDDVALRRSAETS